MDLEFQKTLPKIAGVYLITNTINQKVYVGSTIDLHSRYRTHFYMLFTQRHSNEYLQRSYNLHGFNAFKFEILELVEDINTLLSREQFYLDSYEEDTKYNMLKTAGSTLGAVFTEEHKLKLALSNKTKYPELPMNVLYDKTSDVYLARARHLGKRITLGKFKTVKECLEAIEEFKKDPEIFLSELEIRKLKRKLLIDTKPLGVFYNKSLGLYVARIEKVIDGKKEILLNKYSKNKDELIEARTKFVENWNKEHDPELR